MHITTQLAIFNVQTIQSARFSYINMDKATRRLYINVTDRCNTNCPFCCMYSGTDNRLDMTFDTFKKIVDDTGSEIFELQLEGGEPLIFPKLYLFIEYAIATGRCAKVIVLTNGIELEKNLRRLVQIHQWYDTEFRIKVSVNYHLLKVHDNHLKTLADLVFATELLPNFNIELNTRKRHTDQWIDAEIDAFGLSEINHSFELQSYGRMTGSNYDGVKIVQNIDSWEIYAVDGKCFGTDLVARSEYEKKLAEEAKNEHD